MKELPELIRGMKMSGVVVAVNFIMRHVQPCKERAHPGFDFKGDTDGTRERTESLVKEVVSPSFKEQNQIHTIYEPRKSNFTYSYK